MRLQVTVRRGHVNDDVRRYVESKLAKLGRRLHPETLVEVVLDREQNPKIADDHIVEAELHMKGPNLFGREASSSYEAATGSARRQARAPGRAAPRQEGARAAPPRAGATARARAGRGDRAGSSPHERVAECRCRTTLAPTGARSGSTGFIGNGSGTQSRPSSARPRAPTHGSSSSPTARSCARRGMPIRSRFATRSLSRRLSGHMLCDGTGRRGRSRHEGSRRSSWTTQAETRSRSPGTGRSGPCG